MCFAFCYCNRQFIFRRLLSELSTHRISYSFIKLISIFGSQFDACIYKHAKLYYISNFPVFLTTNLHRNSLLNEQKSDKALNYTIILYLFHWFISFNNYFINLVVFSTRNLCLITHFLMNTILNTNHFSVVPIIKINNSQIKNRLFKCHIVFICL